MSFLGEAQNYNYCTVFEFYYKSRWDNIYSREEWTEKIKSVVNIYGLWPYLSWNWNVQYIPAKSLCSINRGM